MTTSSAVDNRCPHCGGWHPNRTCPRIKVIEYWPDGTVKKIELQSIIASDVLPDLAGGYGP